MGKLLAGKELILYFKLIYKYWVQFVDDIKI